MVYTNNKLYNVYCIVKLKGRKNITKVEKLYVDNSILKQWSLQHTFCKTFICLTYLQYLQVSGLLPPVYVRSQTKTKNTIKYTTQKYSLHENTVEIQYCIILYREAINTCYLDFRVINVAFDKNMEISYIFDSDLVLRMQLMIIKG